MRIYRILELEEPTKGGYILLSAPDRAAELHEHLVTCPKHGYSQYSRWGDGGTEVVTLSDGTQYTIATGDRDCSSSVSNVWGLALNLGTYIPGATYTGNMRYGFTKTGLFEWHPWGDGYSAKRGDIYLNETHHTCMALGGNKISQFSRSEKLSIDGVEGDQDGLESRIQDFYIYSRGWGGILAYVGPDDAGIQKEDKKEDYDMTECVINIPKSDDMASNIMVYVCGDQIHDIPDPEALKYLNEVYKAVHGKDIPTFELEGSRSIPAFQRFLSVIRGGVPDPSIYPAVDLLGGRSTNRACGCKGTE